jgi:hypothetical protein
MWGDTSTIDLSRQMAFSTEVMLRSMTPNGAFIVRWGHSGPIDPSSRSFGFKVDGTGRLYGVLFYGPQYSSSLITQDLNFTLEVNKSYILSAYWFPGYGVRFWVNTMELAPILNSTASGVQGDNNKVWYGVLNPTGGNMSVEIRWISIWMKVD